MIKNKNHLNTDEVLNIGERLYYRGIKQKEAIERENEFKRKELEEELEEECTFQPKLNDNIYNNEIYYKVSIKNLIY